MNAESILTVAAGLILAPLCSGVINRTKAVFAGRKGQPLLQSYRELAKLLRKGAVYSRTTTWIFRAAPAAGLAAVVAALAILPAASAAAPVSFPGDLILFAYCLGVMRFVTVLGALDTGSAFAGMGASREVWFSALSEPALLLGLAALARSGDSLSLSGIFSGLAGAAWGSSGPALALVAAAFLIVVLAENSRIPVDDPNTHLELTMIHEAMILDYSGPDLAFILYGASLKLWVTGGLIVNLVLSAWDLEGPAAVLAFAGGMAVLSVAVGAIESAMARLPLLRVPQLLVGAGAISALAFALAAGFAS